MLFDIVGLIRVSDRCTAGSVCFHVPHHVVPLTLQQHRRIDYLLLEVECHFKHSTLNRRLTLCKAISWIIRLSVGELNHGWIKRLSSDGVKLEWTTRRSVLDWISRSPIWKLDWISRIERWLNHSAFSSRTESWLNQSMIIRPSDTRMNQSMIIRPSETRMNHSIIIP